MESNLMEKLNKEQLEAVMHKDGPLLIVAGAGTGKTAVITQRIAYLIEQNHAKTDEILALTFTEKAAGEMEERVDRLLPFGYLDLWISTFHSFGEKILKAHGLDIGLPANFKLLNEFGQYSLIKKNFNLFDLDYYRPLGNPNKFIRALLSHFSRLKDEDISSEEYLKFAEELRENCDSILGGGKKRISNSKFLISNLAGIENKEGEIDIEIAGQEVNRIYEVANAYHTYEQVMLENSCLDFGDLINYTLKLFRERPAILEKYRRQFKYIMLDEFQDTNWAQYELIKLLAGPKNNLVVVGDDDQCLPGDSKILARRGEIRIDKIKKNDEVATAVGRGYLSYSKVSKVMRSKKRARMISFKTEKGYELTVTNNHKMFCFVPGSQFMNKYAIKSNNKYYYVYLMQKQKLGWRIGITNDLTTRLKLERSADRLVAIMSFKTEEEARYNEIFLSLKYGIPTVCFQERNGMIDKKKWSKKLYSDLDVESGVKQLAFEYGIDLSSHQVCLNAVNRGSKVRIKIILEMCSRKYHSKYKKKYFLDSPQVIHNLSLETSHKPTLNIIKKMGFELCKARKGKRLRIASTDLKKLGKIAIELQKATGGIIESRAKLGRLNITHQKALVIPASNIIEGMFLPVFTSNGIIYDQVIKRQEKNKELTVYDLEIERTHNFIANNIVVHNSVYKFRGASISNILQFKKDYPKSEQIFINKNYRNKQEILDMSYEFIKQNDPNRLEFRLNKESESSKGKKTKFSKKLEAQIPGKGIIELIKGDDLQDEVRKVIEKIADIKIKEKEVNFSDFAILVRANNSAKDFSNALEEAGLPYQFLSSRGLYSKPIIMDIISYFKLLDDYHESSAMYRVLNIPIFGFSYQDIIKINYAAKKKAWSLFTAFKTMNGKLGAEMARKTDFLIKLIDKHSSLAREKSVSEVFLSFMEESGYLKYVSGLKESRSRESLSYLNSFMKRIKAFEVLSDDKSVKAFLEELNIEIEAGEEGALPVDPDFGPDSIKIMTIHSAKGLEFKYVFLPNMVDKKFPTIERRDSIDIPDALVKENVPEGDIHTEEERRLFYVAATRAKTGLYLSWAPDYGGLRMKKPSRFLIEAGLVSDKDLNQDKKKKNEENLLVSNKKSFKEDEKIEYKLPFYLSFSQLSCFSDCPYKYRFSYILKIPSRGKHFFSFGETMHNVLQKTFELVKERSGLVQNDLFSASKTNKKASSKNILDIDIKLEEMLEIYKNCWIEDWYQDDKQKQAYKKSGKRIIKDFHKIHNKKWPETVLLEKGFNLKIEADDGAYSLRGRIDRVDKIDDKVKIVDYKTGNPKEKLMPNDKYQLLIYQMALEDLFREEVKALSFYYLENNSEIEFLGSEKEISAVKDKIRKAIREINKGEFPPKPGPLCAFCDYKDICEYRK
jgi:DNA helicase-2/ATP-dependent DNA helicase PcrA